MKIKDLSLVISLAVLAAGCASTHESVTVEHKGKVTLVHHRRHTANGAVDRIEAIDAKGTFSQAEIHVYNIGRLPHGDHGMTEAHRYYEVTQSAHPNLMQPQKREQGPRTVFTPPNYTPPPNDQRVTDAVAEAKEAKEKLEKAAAGIQQRLAEDNNLRGQLQTVEDENQALQDKLRAAMNTPKKGDDEPKKKSAAEEAAETAVNPLVDWSQQEANPNK